MTKRLIYSTPFWALAPRRSQRINSESIPSPDSRSTKVISKSPENVWTPLRTTALFSNHNLMEQASVEEFTIVESIFLREKNCLLLRAEFTPIYTDYYLHLMELKERHPAGLDSTLKELLAVLTLHLTARPWAETIAWTANLRAPRANFFATGSSTSEYITGRLFTEDVREPDRNFLYSQTTVPGAEASLSTIEVRKQFTLGMAPTFLRAIRATPRQGLPTFRRSLCVGRSATRLR